VKIQILLEQYSFVNDYQNKIPAFLVPVFVNNFRYFEIHKEILKLRGNSLGLG